jgi:hypothetical protein
VRHDAHIANIGHVFDKGFSLCEKGARHDGKRCVLASAGNNAPRKALSAGHNQFHPI